METAEKTTVRIGEYMKLGERLRRCRIGRERELSRREVAVVVTGRLGFWEKGRMAGLGQWS